MSLRSDVKKLQRAVEDEPQPLIDRDEELAAWQEHMDRAAGLIGNAALAEQLEGILCEELVRAFGAAVPYPDPDDGSEEWTETKAWETIHEARRHATAAVLMLSLASPDSRAMVVQSLVADAYGDPVRCWFTSLVKLGSRLPPDLDTAVMSVLMAVYRDRPNDVDELSGRVCNECGLMRPQHKHPPVTTWAWPEGHDPEVRPIPYALPRFSFEKSCPHCGATSYTPSIRTLDSPAAWRTAAERELAL